MGARHTCASTAQLRRYLLRGTSLIAMVTALGVAQAQAGGNPGSQLAILRGVTSIANQAVAAKQPVPGQNGGLSMNGGAPNTAGMASASVRALQYQSRVTSAQDMAQQAQDAARAAAAALEPDVPDGLQLGGLDPVPNPVSAANDTVGINTWDGASAPTQTATDKGVTVTVHQTQSRAILSWQTFNVGKNTTLVFDQSQDGQAQTSWVALNRVVGQLDPTTGLRTGATPAPSQILGTITAPGTVLILNQNGIIFGGTSQVNVDSLIATSLEVGRAFNTDLNQRLSIKDRNLEFLTFGFLGFSDQASTLDASTAFTFSAQDDLSGNIEQTPEGTVTVNAGAQIQTDEGGSILMMAPKIVNSGSLISPLGEVDLQAGRDIFLIRSTGAADSNTPDVRGFISRARDDLNAANDYVWNTGNAIISAPQGYVSLAASDTNQGAIINDGVLEATTSVSRNGFIQLDGEDIQLGVGSTIAISPDDSTATIPQDPTSLLDFKPSRITIGNAGSRIEIDQNAMIFAPGGNVDVGAAPGPNANTEIPGTSRIFVDNGAIIDVAGLTNVLIPASRNSILIDPVKGNELRDDPNLRDSFLNGATVYVDPRLSGVRSDGVAWVGSPLIEAASFAEQVGVSVKELMTGGGHVTLGVQNVTPGSDPKLAADITIKTGATIDMSGGWVTYQAGYVQTTQLVDTRGEIVDISNADPNDSYVGIYEGFTQTQARWGVTQSWSSPVLQGSHYEAEYTEGRDAGSLTLKGSSVVLDGTVYGNAYAGARQIAASNVGTATSTIFGDARHLQGAPSQLPSGGFLFIQALAQNSGSTTSLSGGGDIDVVSQANYNPVSSDLIYGQSVFIDASGNLVHPDRDPNSFLPTDRQQVISLSADALSGMGLADVSLATSGKITVESGASLTLAPGGEFDALAGRAITINGGVFVPSGSINLQTVNTGLGGSVFAPTGELPGAYDIIVNGTLSARGRWINDMGADADHLIGDSFIDGGSISIVAASRQSEFEQVAGEGDTSAPTTNVDISGSILLNQGSLVDVSAGGYVRTKGTFDLSGRGGNLSLIEETTYFQIGADPQLPAGGIPGFRVTTLLDQNGLAFVPINPSQINARVQLDGTILGHGFAGGGTFNLVTPQIAFADGDPITGTNLSLDFFSKTGFANYDITSYKTDLLQNKFDNGLGGYNALLATQVLTIHSGQTLLLSQSMFSPVLSVQQTQALQGLGTGGDLYSVLTPVVPDDSWDARPVNLTLGGLIELDVDRGGSILGEAGAQLTIGKLLNAGTIRMPGGTITQSEILPPIYTDPNLTVAVDDLSQFFSIRPDGTIDEGDTTIVNGQSITNGAAAAKYTVYLLGNLHQDQGIYLAPGSTTDLSGEAIINPRATGPTGPIRTGRIIDGGTLQTLTFASTGNSIFQVPLGVSVYANAPENPVANIANEKLTADAGATIDISGASDTFDVRDTSGRFDPTPVWSNGGTVALGNGGSLAGAIIDANGGSEHALGGTLIILDPVLTQNDITPPGATTNISASLIEASGFDTFVAEGSLSTIGNVTLNLGRGFFLTSRPYDGLADLSQASIRDTFAPTISSGGVLEIDAPYVAFDSNLQSVSTPLIGTPGSNTAIFRADQIDISGAVLFDQSVGDVQLDAKNDLRLLGVDAWQHTFNIDPQSVPNSLAGQFAVNGNLEITAAQVYPTTGTTFFVTSAGADSTITFARSSNVTPATPYSAGGNLTIQAAHIVQGGVVRVPIGSLTLGGNDPLQVTTGGNSGTFAPGTESVDVTSGSITSVSADGLVIPYGTTTDQIEWFFSPTSSDELKAPPQAILQMGGAGVTLENGAKVDVSGGGDLYAYEFISGTGGSHDVLDRFNDDTFSSTNGFQFPDGRQVYAIVPGLSNAEIAAFDPIYSAEYADLYSATAAGKQVYLNGAPGLAPGWYTLLPAKYAMLPGGMRVVENTGITNVVPGSVSQLRDGSAMVTGYYGTAGTNDFESTVRSFSIEGQNVIRKYSNIALTSANLKFAADAAHAGNLAPRLPIDAGRLILAPSATLVVNTILSTAPGKGGRGADVDISGQAFDIVSSLSNDAPDGAIQLTADSLTNLNAASLLIGGVRTDNANGTTSLDVTANSIVVENDASHPLSGPEIVLAVTGAGSSIVTKDGATILASGTVDDQRSGDYLVSGDGAILRVSAGPQRLVTRTNTDSDTSPLLSVGDSDLEGNSLLLESSSDLTASPDAKLKADFLALGAGKVTFTSNGDGLSGLVITPELQALFSQARSLTIRTPGTIDFSSGTYIFRNLALDTPGLLLRDGNDVTIEAGTLSLSNSAATMDTCGSDSAPDCGSGALEIDATEIDFQSGTLRTFGFGGNVTLNAANGILAKGTSTFDAGSASLALNTPFVGDGFTAPAPGQSAPIPDLSLLTTGAVTIANPNGTAIDPIAGTPGSSLSISGESVSVTGTTLRATAGHLDITAQTGIIVGDGTVLSTPGYSHNFGDTADPYIVSAPGGLLQLTAVNGDIDLAQGSTLSVGGGTGNAGTLELQAANGNLIFDGTLDAKAPGAGGSLVLDEKSAFDLSDFSSLFGDQFNGTVAIRTGTGDLTLAAGDTLKAANVMLTADGGLVDIAGTIDASGVNGGDISLYGLDGVTLRSGSLLDAHANGYGSTSTRQAHGGNVIIGTDGVGVITVQNSAVIDVSARNTGDRLVPMTRNGTVYYTYVPGDTGGTVHFRAPVIDNGSGGETVNVTYDGTIKGATSIVLEGFKQFDLAAIAADPNFVGVTINDQGQAVLDLAAVAGTGQSNFLADYGSGTLVQFVQDFDISSSYGNLNGLASSSVFHARPGTELDYSGDIVLASNWNLGAGVVDVNAAYNAGLMGLLPDGKYYILPGMDARVFAEFTHLTYRVGDSVTGEPGILTIRAGGELDIEGSITDGFFQFHDQNDPDYLNQVLGGGDKFYTAVISTSCIPFNCSGVLDWSQLGSLPTTGYVSVPIPGTSGLLGLLFDPAPYSEAANSPAAVGSLQDGTGDPLGSAQMFPEIDSRAIESTSYRLVAGADLTGSSAGTPSVDPLRIRPGATGNLVVEGDNNYSYAASKDGASSQFSGTLLLGLGSQDLTADEWYQAILGENAALDPNSYTLISFQAAPDDFINFIVNAADNYFAPGDFQIFQGKSGPAALSTTLTLAAQFMANELLPNFQNFAGEYKAPKPTIITKQTNADARTLVRTGTGSIDLAAAGNVDLTNGPVTFRGINGDKEQLQVGGTSVYTAGHLVDPTPRVFVDALSGLTVTLDPSQFASNADFLFDPLVTNGYLYGAGGDSGTAGFAGVLITNPVYAEGGGDITITAGGNVLGRRDVWQTERISKFFDLSPYTWIGTGDQAWRTGSIGQFANIMINPQLFTDGVGALGGGDISISAGGDVSDLSVVDTTSVTTAHVQRGSELPTLALLTFGGGDVNVRADGNILGGRFDIASGAGLISALGNIESAGPIETSLDTSQQNELRLRLTDAVVDVTAGGSIQIQGIAALGVGAPSGNVTENLDDRGFYSADAGVSLLANGAVTIDNFGGDVLTPGTAVAMQNTLSAVYPGSLGAYSLTGDITIGTGGSGQANGVILYPSPLGELQLAAADNILPTVIGMEDGDPGILPGVFSIFSANETGVLSGRAFLFPGVLPSTTEVQRQNLHNRIATHLNDPVPNRIYAGNDILDMILAVPKQTRVGAGRDIVNMMFFGQNLSPDDITRIVAGRDITATTELVQPVLSTSDTLGAPEAAVQGNTFIIGGPGSFFLEAGRDAGPFLNSAVTDGFVRSFGNIDQGVEEVYAGGIVSVGNDWNPWLASTGASLFVEFGVGKGQDFDALRDYYLDPANLPNLSGYLFVQVHDANGNLVPDRSRPIYAPILIDWMKAHEASVLKALYGTTNVDFQQAYDAFKTLPDLTQRVFMVGDVYFNELTQTSIPTGPSFKQYARGYQAINLLFPASLGYTQNDLTGGSNGSNQPVETGDLDLRLATIQTDWGGDIYILGPGGRVLAGSTVRTSEQAARRTYDGGRLFLGNIGNVPLPSTITAIPIGFEGILTLRGGSIDTFTDTDFLLNQSRLFTEDGGDIAMWSSNGDLNAGQGPKTAANFPPVIVRVDEDLFSELDSASGVSGAGIAAFEPAPGVPAPDVFLIAPRGTVDAGDAGVRVAGNLYVAALAVANAENFSVGGSSFGVPAAAAVDVGAQTSGSAASAAAEQAAQAFSGARNANAPSIISVEVIGFSDLSNDEEERRRKKKPQS